jgi:serine/threonine protein phosphatase PrpC
MLEQVRTTYSDQRKVRYLTITGIVIFSAIFYRVAGGFPPRAWVALAETLSHISLLWMARGASVLLPLGGLILLALVQLLTWLFLLWMLCWTTAQEWRYMREWQHVKASLRQAQAILASGAAPAYQPWEEQAGPLAPLAAPAPAKAQNGHHAPSFPFAPVASYSVAEQQTLPDTPIPQVHTAVATPTLTRPLPANNGYKLVVGTGLDAGIKRKNKPNEDCLIAYQSTLTREAQARFSGLFVVADGMGGHANGRDASHMAIQAICDAIIPTLADEGEISEDELIRLLKEGVQHANSTVYRHNQEYGLNTGTTMTAALIADELIAIANVGDSRTYLYRADEGLAPITRDHSTVARLVESGQITPDEVYTHPQRNEIYRNLGDDTPVEVDTRVLAIESGMTLLLCSDGLWEMVRDAQIERILHETLPNAAQACRQLLQAALDGGGLDNISVIVVHVL